MVLLQIDSLNFYVAVRLLPFAYISFILEESHWHSLFNHASRPRQKWLVGHHGYNHFIELFMTVNDCNVKRELSKLYVNIMPA